MRRSEDGGEGEGNYIDVREASKFHWSTHPSRGPKIGMTALVTGGTVKEGEVHAKQREFLQ